MKRWWWISLILILVAGISWQVVKKEQEASVATKETTPTLRQPASEKEETPAVSTPGIVQKKEEPKREWLGDKEQILKNGRVQFKNKVSSNWMALLEKQLKRGLPPEVNLTIQPERDLVLLEGQQVLNAQQVVVIHHSPKDRHSFRALVDSESGKIIRTWDQTIHENIRKPASLSGLPLRDDD